MERNKLPAIIILYQCVLLLTLSAVVPGAATAEVNQPGDTPPSAASLLEHGRARQRIKDTDGAIAAYQQAIKIDPNLAEAHWELGWSHYVRGEYDKTVICWDKARQLNPDFPELAENYPMAAELARLMSPKCLTAPETAAPPRQLHLTDAGSLTIAATGDIMLGSDYPPGKGWLPSENGAELFRATAPYLTQADITIGNLEGAFASGLISRKCAEQEHCYVFRMPPRLAPALAAAGFDVMNNANNHSHDFGSEGVKQTLDTLRSVGIQPTGTLGTLASLTVRGSSVAVIGAAPNVGCYPLNDDAVLIELASQAAANHDIVIAAIHGGAEGPRAVHVPDRMETFYGEQRGDLRRTARLLIDAGVDLIVGHGPHVLRGMEVYQDRLIAYSLGNFCVYGGFSLAGPLSLSAILQVELAADGALRTARIIPVRLEKPGVPALDPEGQSISLIRKLSVEDFGASAAPFDADGLLEHGR